MALIKVSSGRRQELSGMRAILNEYPFIIPKNFRRVVDALSRAQRRAGVRLH